MYLAALLVGSFSVGFWENYHDVAVLSSFLLPMFVVAAKNRLLWLLLGLGFPLLWLIPTFRLAPPESMWARGIYDDSLLGRAEARFGSRARRDWSRASVAVVLVFVAVFILGLGLLRPVLESA